jgi:hypothetical protein
MKLLCARHFCRKYLAAVALLGGTNPAHADCATPRLIAPAGRITVDPRPAIRWSAVAGATGYVLRVQSRVPEGPQRAAFDVAVTDTEFIPPAALAEERAKVTVRVAARCAGGVGAAASGWFLIDATAACPSPRAVRITHGQGYATAEWAPASGVAHYEVRLHAATDGSVLKALETREPRARLDGDLPDGAVLSVRPRCANTFGEPTLAFVTL